MSHITIGFVFSIIFLGIGALNVILVDTIPGLFYLALAVIYLPQTDVWSRQKIGYKLPFVVKFIVGIAVLWGTLAVGDLAEVLGL